MRMLVENAGENTELRSIQETSQQLTFQTGTLPQLAAIDRGWRNSAFGLFGMGIYCTTIGYFMWQAGVFHTILSNPIGVNLFLLVWGMGMFGIPLAVIAHKLLSAYYVTWTFDRLDRTLRRDAVNLLRNKYTKIYRFDDIEQLAVEQGKDPDNCHNKCCELYLKLRSNQEFTMSQSCYTRDRREQAISLQYHREIAEKMRIYLGYITVDAERADRVYIPTVREVESEKDANWELIKSVGSVLFSPTEKRQSEIENIREKLITDRDNPQLWETLSWHLAMNKEHYRESIEALSQAEALYRDRGDNVMADELAQKISLFQAKI